ncbi:hypothetical protein BCR43DRAFT_488036 [Syncephalastrum racemosum]|uniref:HCP-like protein n=1 Tax=Syncephalastrum racemosum TaxID=13706 RepID=A0A1X2HI08_SYNRA|nr:hypothetical protein BCR43DRAFT_488036 [Syncephalastrum racemosum]
MIKRALKKRRYSLFARPSSSATDPTQSTTPQNADFQPPSSWSSSSLSSSEDRVSLMSTNGACDRLAAAAKEEQQRLLSGSTVRRHSRQRRSEGSSAFLKSDTHLQLGMQCHERGELEQATYFWRLSAESESPLGLFFYGIALRHGWGCRKDPVEAVRHLQKAAECAVYDLQSGIAQSAAARVARSELVLAVYELGVCFRHGWGVPKNLSTAVYYFEVAANLGDADAQNDLAFCLAHGQGTKKDLFKAAMYYRMAERQGQGIIGNSWIWKSKYDVVDDPHWQDT